MLTSTHILMAAAVSSRPKMKPWQILLAWLGGFAPDASIFLMVAYARMLDTTGLSLWRKPDGIYWQEPWQAFSAISNSFPLWGMVVITGYLLFRFSKPLKQVGLAVLIFSVGYFVHITVDFITHADDAHVHFWPLTDWRFHSPISYWQRQYYGQIVGLFEVVMGLSIIAYLIWSFKQWPVRIMAGLLAVPYVISMWFVLRSIV